MDIHNHGSLGESKPDLIASLIILLISAAITIFLFWISSQYLGQENFQRLPDWITSSYKGVWSSAITGTAGVGLAIFKSLTGKGSPQPNYLKYIGITTGCLLVPIAIIVSTPSLIQQVQGRKRLEPPSDVARIDVKSTSKADFDLESQPPTVPARFILKGTFKVSNNKIEGHLDSGKITVAKELPKGFPEFVDRISFRACFLGPLNGFDQMQAYPDNPKASDSIDVHISLSPGTTSDLPTGDFSFSFPKDKKMDRAWLCAALWNGIGYFPAQ